MSPKPRHFLFVIDTLEVGGIQRQLLEVIAYLCRSGNQATVASFRTENAVMKAQFEESGARVILLDKRHRIDMAFMRRFRALVNNSDFSLIHAMSPQTGFWTSLTLNGSRAPFMSSILNNYSLQAPAVLLAEKLSTARRVDAVLVNSAAAAETYRSLVSSRVKVHMIHNGVADGPYLSRAEAREVLNMAEDIHAVCTIGRLVGVKRHRDLIQGMKYLSAKRAAPHLYLIGDGPLRENLRDYAKELGVLDRIHFLGEMANPQRYLKAFDVFALPSDSEGLPNALLEAMAAGLPAVATSVGGIGEVISHWVNGVLVPPRQPRLLADAIGALLHDPATSREIAIKGRSSVLQAFSMEEMVRRTECIYNSLIGSER